MNFLLFIAQRNDCNAGRSQQETTRRLPLTPPAHPHKATPLPLGSHSTLLWPYVPNVTSGQRHCTGEQGWRGTVALGKGQRAECALRLCLPHPSWAHRHGGTGQLRGTGGSQAALCNCSAHFYGFCVAGVCSWDCSCYSSPVCSFLHGGRGEQTDSLLPCGAGQLIYVNFFFVKAILRHDITRLDTWSSVGFYTSKTIFKMSSNMSSTFLWWICMGATHSLIYHSTVATKVVTA